MVTFNIACFPVVSGLLYFLPDTTDDTTNHRFFAHSNQTPIVRYIELPEKIKPLTIALPLRILVMISSPSDYDQLNVEREKSMLKEALDPLIKASQVNITWLEQATMSALQKCLRQGMYHIFHFIGHGGFDEKKQEGVLVFEDQYGKSFLAEADRLSALLYDHRSLRLAVLNACESAKNSPTDTFAGVATSLIRQGIPAVISMQFEITDKAAIVFSGEFYSSIAQGYPVDAALAEARKAIYAIPNDLEWATPVLFMRSPDGVLFELTTKSDQEESVSSVIEPKHSEIHKESVSQRPSHKEGITPVKETVEESATLLAIENIEKEAIIHQPPIECYCKLAGHLKRVNTVTFSPDGNLLASGGDTGLWESDTSIRLWNIAEEKLLISLQGHSDSVKSVAFSPDGKLLASGSNDKTIKLWSVEEKRLLYTLGGHTDWVRGVAFSPDGKLLASGSDDKTIKLWSVDEKQLLHTLDGHSNYVRSVVFSPDGKLLASGSYDKTVRLWSIKRKKLLHTQEGHADWVRVVAFSPDGKLLASGSDDKTIKLWLVDEKKLLHTLDGHTSFVRSVAFSPDGKLLASGSDDKTVKLWLVEQKKLYCTLEQHTSNVYSIAFSPNGMILASAGGGDLFAGDNIIRLWKRPDVKS